MQPVTTRESRPSSSSFVSALAVIAANLPPLPFSDGVAAHS
jgi:hypothetical protein